LLCRQSGPPTVPQNCLFQTISRNLREIINEEKIIIIWGILMSGLEALVKKTKDWVSLKSVNVEFTHSEYR
jgi:hypothetical protein